MMNRLIVTIVATLVACTHGVSHVPDRAASLPQYVLLPTDAASQDTSLVAFRADFLAAVKRRDVESVVAKTDPAIDAIHGSDGFRQSLEWNRKNNAYWHVLESALVLGGSFSTTRGKVQGRREFCAPYTYSAYPSSVPQSLQGETDPWAVIATNVPLRATPDSSGKILALVSYELVLSTGEEARGTPPPQWRGVQLASGVRGWIAADAIRDPADFHACFAKVGQEWMLTAFERDVPRR